MTYQGYMALANEDGETIELVNASRVQAYTNNLAPAIGLRGCDDCEGLDEALGETYIDPVTDNAPWYDPTDPETGDFYGIYPLAFEGIDDSTRTIESAELSGDGSVVVGSRYTGKDIRVSGMAFAKDEAALYAGMSWLDSALNGTEEGRCFGDRLNVYSSCPPIQVLPPNFAEPYEMDLGTITRVNRVLNPRASDVARWTGNFGTTGAGTETALTNGDLVMPNGDLINQYMRYTWTVASTGGQPYWETNYPSSTYGTTLPIGTQVAAHMYIRSSTARTVAIRLVGTDGVAFASAQGPSVVLVPNVWTPISAVLTTTIATNYPRIRVIQANTNTFAIGATVDVTAGMSVIGSSTVGTYFDGRTTNTATRMYGWVGDINASESNEFDSSTLANEASQWTTTSGTITPTGNGLDFNWNLGDSQKIACREITDLIPGEQYQLRMRVENFGDYYVRLGDTCASERENLAPNPRLLGWSWQGGGVLDVEADLTAGGPIGLGYRQAITTSANASSPYSCLMPSDEYVPVTAGVVYQVSLYIKGPVGVTRLSASFRNEAGSTIASDVRLEQNVSMDGTWKRLSGVVVPPTGAVSMEIFTATSLGVGQIQPNMEFGAANLLIETPNYSVVRTNLQTDPRAVGPGTASWNNSPGTGGVIGSAFVAGAVDGPTLYGTTTSSTYKRNTVTTAPSGGTAGPFLNTTMPSDLPSIIPTGTRWVGGMWVRSNRTVSGTVRYRVMNDDGVAIDELNEAGVTLTANVWQYVSAGKTATADLINPATIQVFFMVGGSGGASGAVLLGDIYDTTGGLGLIGSSDETYFDSVRPSSGLTTYRPVPSLAGPDIAQEVLADAAGSYFDGFTGGFHWQGAANDSVSSSDLGIDYQIVTGWSGNPPTEPTVLDFIPRTDSIFLAITPTQIGAPVPVQDLLIESALVRRIPRPGVVAFGSGNEYVPPSDGWTHLAPEGMQVEWIAGEAVQWDAVRTDAQAPSGSALTYTTAHGVQRTIFGLIPGNRYRLMIEFTEGWRVTDGSPLTTTNPFVSLGNTSGAIATYTQNNDITHYWVVEFTANATSSLLAFHPNANLALGSFGSVTWSFDQYMVEEILATDATEPRPGRFQERTMYEVKASQGPILTNVRTSPCGVMGQVTFALRAGNPFKYRSPIFAGGLPTGTSSVVGDVPCSADGLPQVVNFAYNPSLEANTTDWAGGGTNITQGRINLFGGYIGDYVFQVSAIPGVGRADQITAYYFPPASGPVPIGGEQITVSIYFRTLDLASLGTYEWIIYVTADGFDPMTFTGTEVVSIAEEWHRIEQTFTLPGNVPLSGIETKIYLPDTVTTGGIFMADALMIQRGPVATDPFDETMPGVEWTGTPNASALALTPSIEDLSADPDCPAPPAPPAPPLIDDDCIDSPASYNRTVVSIPADTVPQNLTAYPVITLTAGSEPVRQARIRFWENPDNLTISDIDPCSYDGEIIVSYLADGATMVIDGVLMDATVSKPGFQNQNANHALYGPDGGPVDWPALTGGIPYLVTLELNSASPYTDTLMSVDLVVRD